MGGRRGQANPGHDTRIHIPPRADRVAGSAEAQGRMSKRGRMTFGSEWPRPPPPHSHLWTWNKDSGTGHRTPLRLLRAAGQSEPSWARRCDRGGHRPALRRGAGECRPVRPSPAPPGPEPARCQARRPSVQPPSEGAASAQGYDSRTKTQLSRSESLNSPSQTRRTRSPDRPQRRKPRPGS